MIWALVVWVAGVPLAYFVWLADASDGFSWAALRAQHVQDASTEARRFGIYFALTGTFGLVVFGVWELVQRTGARR